MLLPALSSARDKARRIVCLGNLKQQFAASALYAGDYEDMLPPIGQNYQRPMGRGKLEGGRNPFRRFLDQYTDLQFELDKQYDPIYGQRSIVQCPSNSRKATNNEHVWTRCIDYSFNGFGVMENNDGPAGPTGDWQGGTTTLSAVGEAGPLGMKVLSIDIMYWPTSASFHNYNITFGQNHQNAGGNVLTGDGSARWVHFNGWIPSNGRSSGVPKAYYTQRGDTKYDNGFQLILRLPPRGNVHGGNSPGSPLWEENRRLYGYRR
jgi:hypothetical protein